jgi:alcohol dehydrogenase (cytochrome c)
LAVFGSVLVLFVAASAEQNPGPTQAQLNDAVNDSMNWLYADHDYQGLRYSALAQIDASNVQNLAPVCSYALPLKEATQTAPIVYNGIMYATTAHQTVAINAANCNVVWVSQRQPQGHEAFTTQRGPALKDGKLVRGTGDGFLIALDATTGKELWSRQIANSTAGYFLSMPPLIYDDLVLIGPAGAEAAVKGWVGAFRLSNGQPVWKFNTIPEPGDPAAKTWGGDANVLKYGGGTVWTPMSFDVQNEQLQVPVANPAPDFYDKDRPGDNLYTASIVALNVRTGKLAWYYQAVPHDVRDYDLTHVAPMFTLPIGGQKHTVIALTGKDGRLRALDRDTRKLLYTVPFTTRENADGPIENAHGRICPGLLGGHEWNGAAYSPRLRALVVPATDWCSRIKPATERPDPAPQHKLGQYFGGEFEFDPWPGARGWLTVFDAATGKTRWRYESRHPMIGGVVVTGGDLIFAGELTGDLLVFDATSGKVLHKHNVGNPIAGGVLSYAVNGKQHVAVVSGFVGGAYGQNAKDIGGGNPTITVLALR